MAGGWHCGLASGRLFLSAQCRLQGLDGRLNLLGIARGVGFFQGPGSGDHPAVMLTQGLGGLLSFLCLALKGLIDGLAEGIPELLLLAPIQRHHLGLVLPALLQGLDRVNAQGRLGTQGLGLVDHGAAAGQAVLTCRIQGRRGGIDQGLPLAVQLRKGFLAQVAGLAPALLEAVQAAKVLLPIGIGLLGLGPGTQLVHQGAALRAAGLLLFTGFFQPGLDHLVCLVAGFVKALPESVIGRAPLVAGLPLFAQGPQGLLLFAPAQGFVDQGLGFGQQLFPYLVGTPALPTLEFTGRAQSGVGLGLQGTVQVAGMLLEGLAQVGRGLGGGLAMAFGQLGLQYGQRGRHDLAGGGTLLGAGSRIGLGTNRFFCRGLPTASPQLVGPDGHGRQGRSWVGGRGNGQGQGRLEGLPDRQQLGAGRVQQGRETGIHAGPDGVLLEGLSLVLPS